MRIDKIHGLLNAVGYLLIFVKRKRGILPLLLSEKEHTLTNSEVPAHTHTRGTMNITGGVTSDDVNYYWGAGTTAKGAFTNAHIGGSYISSGAWSGSRGNGFTFDASRNWTGETSSFGGSQPHNIMNPYHVCYIWRRTA